jgi:hypothetical protein
VACALFALLPFHGGGRREMVRRPKAYGFDTGFVAFVRGWNEIRDDDRGHLWEHLVLDILRTGAGAEGLFYWRDKSGREVDFVIRRGQDIHAVECKINPDRFNPECLKVFRALYPRGRNYLVCPGIQDSYERRFEGLILRITGCRNLLRDLGEGVGIAK